MIEALLSQDVIIITTKDIKNKLLLKKSKMISSSIIKSIDEFINDFVETDNIMSLVTLGNKYGFHQSDILYKNSLITKGFLFNNKLQFLNSIYNHKINNDSLKLYKMEIVVLDYYFDNDIFNYLINQMHINVKYLYHYQKIVTELKIAEFNTQKEEVFNVIYNISKLIKSGITLDKIFIIYKNNEYINIIKEVFGVYHIPYDISEKYSLIEYNSTKDFIKGLKNNLDSYYDTFARKFRFLADEGGDALNSLVNEFIGYNYLNKEIVDAFIHKAKNTYVNAVRKYGIKVLNDYNDIYNKDDYIFILGFNQDIIPEVYKDDDYLLDKEKDKLNIKKSSEKNIYEKQKITNFIGSYPNIYISYPLSSMSRILVGSSLINDLEESFKIIDWKKYDINISYSKRYSKLQYNRLLDDFNKYNDEKEELRVLNKVFNDRKISKDNEIKKEGKLKEKLESSLVLSYTSLSEFYKCPYSFYLKRILKINKTSDTNDLFIGNLFHDVLYNVLSKEKEYSVDDIKDLVLDFYNREKIEINNKNNLFLDIYVYYLYNIYLYILKISKRTIFDSSSYEEKYSMVLPQYGYKLEGKIDKVLTTVIKGKEYAIVLDYKTGSDVINFNNIIHGYDMQILIYYYLLNSIKEVEFGGGYIEHILPKNIIKKEKNKTYAELLDNYYRYNGYTNRDIVVISSIDRNFDDKSYLYGIDLKGTTDLSANAIKRTITDDDYHILLSIVEKKIKEATQKIYNGEFKIKPTYLDKLACSFCPYKGICYYKEEDIEYLKKYNDLSFFKEVDDDSN